HNNWSLGTDTGVPLMAPGKDALGNLQFITFFVNTLYAVQRHNGLLKASIASATNAHRLGANEAPPAIVSAFLGRTMTGVLHDLLEMPSGTPIEISGKKGASVGAIGIPQIFIDNTDRNRTSPFAFTGNRFEFRAVGASANCAGSMITLNTAVAEQLLDFKEALDANMAEGKALDVAVMDTLKPLIASILDVVCFEGNGYSDEWRKEAARRGLDTETIVPKMLCEYEKKESVEMFTRCGVFNEKELHARNEVKLETYVKKVQIEARVIGRMALNHIIPAALDYQTRLLQNASLQKSLLGDEAAATELALAKEISALIADIRRKVEGITEARKKANKLEDKFEKALAYSGVADLIPGIRKPIDDLEEIVDNATWPLPKYRELLFIS
ncbi:MAG: glutamine synthetase type III, partial [Bacteroidales bacterium]|nr:glutamine synthetase type III [Bacteroidales bacterium]